MIKESLKKVRGIITGFLALIGLSSVLLTLLLVFLIAQIKSSSSASLSIQKPQIEDTILNLDLHGEITAETPNPREAFFASLTGERQGQQLGQLRKVLRRAAEDERLKGLYLNLRGVAADFTTMQELRRSLLAFKKSGKPIFVNMDSAGNLDYFLASAGTRINLSPLGGMSIPGPMMSLSYFGPALKKLGLEMEVFRAGKYKSAMEPFVASKPSEASLEMYQAIEESLRSELAKSIAEGRNQSEAVVRGWLKVSSFTRAEALKMGAVDEVLYEHAFKKKLEAASKVDTYLKWRSYLAHSDDLDKPRVTKGDEKIGYLEAVGEIRMYADGDAEVITPEPTIKALQWLAKEEDVKAVVFRVDSPGGSALASDMIWEEVRRLAAVKPLVVSMGRVAASGGYYIAAPAKKIMAEAQTITGSIGVIGASLVGKEVSDKYGIHLHTITQSDRANYYDFSKSSSEEDKKVIGRSIDEVYQTFLAKVAQGRAKTKDQVHAMAQGRVYTGRQALELGLVDYIGGLEEAFRTAKDLAQLNPELLYPVVSYEAEPANIFDCLGKEDGMMDCMNRLEGGLGLSSLVPSPQLKVLAPLQRLTKIMADDEQLMYWPGQVTWDKQERSLL